MKARVSDIINIMEEIAPSGIAEKWDNPGLQTGDEFWEVEKIVTSLDPLKEVVDDAAANKANLLITHHPLIFKPLKSIIFSSPLGQIISSSYANKLAIYSAHTNLDAAKGGLNDIIAEILGLEEMRPLICGKTARKSKLVFFIPEDYKDDLLNKLYELDAGVIGNYTGCSFSVKGKGTFKSPEGSKPFIGAEGEETSTDEVRVEVIVNDNSLSDIISALNKFHPYETPAYDIYPLANEESTSGIGRTGQLSDKKNVHQIGEILKKFKGNGIVRAAGNLTTPIRKVAICTGSGSSLFGAFLKSDADLFISGDLHYHDARIAEEKGKAVIDVGHFASEKTAMNIFSRNLKKEIASKGYSVQIEESLVEQDPFNLI